jgi:hypothetical protein
MIHKQNYSKKWLLGLTTAAGVYAGLWFVTEACGVPQVRGIAAEAMRQSAFNAATPQPTEQQFPDPTFSCSAGAYAPLMVRTKCRWENGLQSADGKSLYLWLFGHTFRIHEMRSTLP